MSAAPKGTTAGDPEDDLSTGPVVQVPVHQYKKLVERLRILEEREADERENERSSAVEAYWKEKQGEDYGSY